MNSFKKQIIANQVPLITKEDEMPLMETHLCMFCAKKMTDDAMGHYCQGCDAYKGYQHYVFERMYRGKTYRFEYDLSEQKFSLVDEAADWNQNIIMQSDNLYIITPKNWEKKLPTILVFS